MLLGLLVAPIAIPSSNGSIELTGLEAAMAERDEFERAFDRRPNGKWVQRRDGKTLTVFKRGEGTWCWSIFGADGTQFSDRSYECEGDAVGGLASELEVGTW